VLLVLFWSVLLGIGLAHATTASTGTVDVVPDRYQLGQSLYVESCSACHIALPPAVMPTQTWRDLIQDSQHYGTTITPPVDPQRLAIWQYLQTYSRGLNPNETAPYRIQQSRFFKALHPRVEFSQPVNLGSCTTCHPGATQFDFRSLTPEAENTP
jgi:hypothetical protein